MSFDDYLNLLDRLIEDGAITLAEAEVLALQYDEFDNIEPVLAPEDIQPWTENLNPIALAIIASTLFIILRKHTSRASAGSTVASLSYQRRTALFGSIQDSFKLESGKLARDLANGVLTPAQWQTAMNTSILSHFRSAAYAAYGTVSLTPAQEAAFLQAVRVQQAYLTRFADQYVLSQVRGAPWTEAYITNRAAMYGGAVRAFSTMALETGWGYGAGWVIQYSAQDDNRTCSECISAMQQGPYLPGRGPMPGDICLGKHYCRCTRYPVYDLSEYERLVGENA